MTCDLCLLTSARMTGWHTLAYFWFWLSANATPATFYGVNAAMAAGLSVWEALACQFGEQGQSSRLLAMRKQWLRAHIQS